MAYKSLASTIFCLIFHLQNKLREALSIELPEIFIYMSIQCLYRTNDFSLGNLPRTQTSTIITIIVYATILLESFYLFKYLWKFKTRVFYCFFPILIHLWIRIGSHNSIIHFRIIQPFIQILAKLIAAVLAF